MVDLFVDEVSLVEIQTRNGAQVLVFKNADKDESLYIPITNDELLNIYNRCRIRCETLELITRKD